MKKSLVVLLIAVLALSAVFAADVAITVEGDVSASYVFDFDDMTGTYNVPELNGALAWELVLPVAKAGSEYPYIDVAGEIEVDLADVANYLAPAVDFTTFAIVGEDWKVDFLATIGTLDYAVSAIDTAWYNPTNAYNSVTGRAVSSALTYRWQSAAYYDDAVAISKDGIGTLTFIGTIDEVQAEKTVLDVKYFNNLSEVNDFVAKNPKYKTTGIADSVTGMYSAVKYATVDSGTTTFAVEGESEELKLADNITTQFGFGFAKVDVDADTDTNAMNAGFSTKSSYEDILTVAADFGYVFEDLIVANEGFSVDVASSFKYEMVSVDVYYAHGPLSFYNGEDLYAINSYYQYYTPYKHTGDLLSAKASVEVEEIGTTFTFTGKDLLTGKTSLSYEAVNTYFDNYTFTFGAAAVDNAGGNIAFDSVSFLAEADYAEEVGVTSYAGVTAYYSTKNSGYVFPVFEVGFAYDKNGFNFSVDFSSLREINEDGISGTREQYADLDKTFENTAFTVKAGYEAEMFTLSGAVEFNTHEKSAKSYRNWSLCQGLYVSAGIESDKLVDGATLSLDYASAELLDGTKATGKFGSVTAAVTVEF